MHVRRIITIDRQPGSDIIAIWTTTRTSRLEVSHTNANAIDAASNPDAVRITRSLTRDCAVLITDGSVLDGLPVEGEPLTREDIAAWVTATKEHQQDILAAMDDYKLRTRSNAIVSPAFVDGPDSADFVPTEDTATQRALSTADYLLRAWTLWLQTEEERRRRTARPKTGETPWMMPDQLNDPEVASLPAALAERIHAQPLV
jgi:hypothetical protein